MTNLLSLISLILLCYSCSSNLENGDCDDQEVFQSDNISKLGINYSEPVLDSVYTSIDIDLGNVFLPVIDNTHLAAVSRQEKIFKKSTKSNQYGNLMIADSQLLSVAQTLSSYQNTEPYELFDNLEVYKIWGGDKKGHVQFTGYFTPIIEVNDTLDETYFYPIYNFPEKWDGHLPTRAQIDGDFVFDGMGLELAYAKSAVDIYFMQVQGSGYVQYPNGKKILMEYNGSNRHPYRSIGKYIVQKENLDLTDISMEGIKKYLKGHQEQVDSILFQNPSYTFFRFSDRKPSGAGQVPLTKKISVAVDDDFIPLGSCLLAKIPRTNKQGAVIDYEYNFLFAQDVGGAIKGTGHIDVYMGLGDKARKKASNLYHYGELFLLLPSKEKSIQ